MATLCLPSYSSSSTPLSSYLDGDTCFRADIDSISQFVAIKLGSLTVGVEMHPYHVWTNVCESFLEYSNLVNLYHAKGNLSSFLGVSTGSLTGSEQKYSHFTQEMYKRIARGNEIENGMGGDYQIYSSSFATNAGQQIYDLQQIMSGTIGNQRMQIIEIWHYEPYGAMRYYPQNEYTTSIMVFGQGGSFTADQAHYLLPVWQDVSRAQQFKFSYKFRRSMFSYDIQNNMLKVFPSPQRNCAMWFSYRLMPDPLNPDYGFEDPTVFGVSDVSNIPFGIINYCGVNSMGKQWIREFALAISKISLGEIRSKYSTIPIPNGDVSLNGSELVSQGKEEAENLKEKLREMLEETLPHKLAERDAQLLEQTNNVFKYSPLKIYRL